MTFLTEQELVRCLADLRLAILQLSWSGASLSRSISLHRSISQLLSERPWPVIESATRLPFKGTEE